MEVSNELINKAVEDYKKCFDKDNSRELSWEHCYLSFKNAFSQEKTEELIDYLSLQLAFYLASWGMYRGSSFILEYDYRIHTPAVEILLEDTWKGLRDIKCSEFPQYVGLFDELERKLNEYYLDKRNMVSDSSVKEVSKVLTSKIMLGTLGCTPAYDSYVIKAIKKYEMAKSTFCASSVSKLAQRFGEIIKQKDIYLKDDNEIQYPQMKILDMGLWKFGEDIFEEEKRK